MSVPPAVDKVRVYLQDQRADERVQRDCTADECDVGHVSRPIRDAQRLGCGRGVLRPANEGE